MILLFVLAVALTIAVLRGGNLLRLASLPLRWPAIPILAFVPQIGIIFSPELRSQRLWDLQAGILALSYAILLITIWINRRVPGMVLLGLGLILNLVVMLANGGYMPITPETMQRIGYREEAVKRIETGERLVGSKDVVLLREQTHLWALSDILVLPHPFPFPSAFSLGDVLIAAGACLVVQRALLGPSVSRTAHAKEASGAVSLAKDPPSEAGHSLSRSQTSP